MKKGETRAAVTGVRPAAVKKTSLFILFTLLLLAVLLVTGCRRETKSYQIDTAALLQSMTESVQFACALEPVADDVASSFFTLEDGVKVRLAMGSGTFADQAAVFTSTDEEQAASTEAAVETYVTELADSFSRYIPEEASKAEKALIVRKGRYVVLCISDDEGAQDFIDGYFEAHNGEEESEAPLEPADTPPGDSGDDPADDPAVQGGEEPEPPVPTYPVIEQEGKVRDYGGIIAVGNAAYELYTYVEGTAEKYADAVNGIAADNPGRRIFDVLIPLSSGITLPDALYGELTSSDQKEALSTIAGKLDPAITVINPYEALMRHRDEYIYFRTDHHWTADGAYYAYEAFCEAAGMTPIPREEREEKDFEGFIGSFYKETNEDEKLAETPDTVRAYEPVGEDVSLTYTTSDGAVYDWKVIWDVENYDASLKYCTFIAGDNPYTVIRNDGLAEDAPRCIVVKESFGNAMVPYLVDHYARIYVVDYRYWAGSVRELADEVQADDIIFMNNLSMTRSDYLVGKLAQVR